MSQQVLTLLNQSLDPNQSKAAGQSLKAYESQPGFLLELLRIVNGAELRLTTRLAASVLFKNIIRQRWTDEEGNHLFPEQDVTAIKTEIIDLMISLPPPLQAQLGEAVSLIADSDFPQKWGNLVETLVHRLGDNPKTNNGVLTVAHSIFKRWRPLFRSDDLFREIALVLSQFCIPYLKLVEETHQRIPECANDGPLQTELLRTLSLCVKLFYDLNCQDIPEFFEDNMQKLMSVFKFYLTYSNPLIEQDSDELEASILEEIKAGICEALQLYAQRYEEEFGPLIPDFAETVWNLLKSIGPQEKYDLLVNRALGFLHCVAQLQSSIHMFEGPETLSLIVEKVIIPNMAMRTSDEELFEDDPIEYVRRDLEGGDSDTRRRASADFLRSLTAKLESQVTQVVMKYVNEYLELYNAVPTKNWRYRNTATYLFSSIAAKGNITSAGVSTTNLLVDVISFFNNSIAPILINPSGHPILQVDAIKFIYIFRNQLTKEQLSQALPILVRSLNSQEFVVYTYAAITIERILSIRQNGQPIFTKDDIRHEAHQLIQNLMGLIVKGNASPEKLAENEFLMKCIMRVLITAQNGCKTFAGTLLPHLVQLVIAVSANPSNPRFSHYLFESIGALVRYAGDDIGIEKLEFDVVQPLLSVLAQDVTEFVPYILQTMTQVLNTSSTKTLPSSFENLVRPLLSPVLWETKGNVPALVGQLQAILAKGSHLFVEGNLLQPLLGVFQNLIASRANDNYGLDLLEYILVYLGPEACQPFSKNLAQLLLMRLQSSRTEKLTLRFTKFLFFLASAQIRPGLGPEFCVTFLDQVQSGIFGQVFETLILPDVQHIHGVHDRRVAVIGLSSLLCRTTAFTKGQYNTLWAKGLEALVKLMRFSVAQRQTEFIVDVDLEELSFGSTYVKLSTTSFKPLDPAPGISSPNEYVVSCIKSLVQEVGQPLLTQLSTLDAESQEYLRSLEVQ